MKKLLILSAVIISACSQGMPNVTVETARNNDFTGRGNKAETLTTLSIRAESPCKPRCVTVELNQSGNDVSTLGLYLGERRLGSVKVRPGNSSYRLRCTAGIKDTKELRICADICDDAPEGDIVSCDVKTVRFGKGSVTPARPTSGGREILLCRKLLYAPGSFGSKAWRIPALLQLQDGTLLAVNDRRNESEEDLPGRIDVVFRYSTDRGRSWSEPGYVVHNGGFMKGYGDPGLAQLPDGTIICTFCGGENFSRSSLDNPQCSYISTSRDNGRTWSEPRNLTADIWGPDAVNPICKNCHSSFFSSGNSLVLKSGPHKGRMLVANVTMYDGDSWLSNHAVYTDDGGETWQVSEAVTRGNGDEAKMVQLQDGSILMSIRTNGNRLWARSFDDGQTWPAHGDWPEMHVTACNGDMIGVGDSLLLHSVPFAMERRDITVLASRDQGRTWTPGRNINPGPGQYSSLTILDDGTVGAYIERNTWGTELWYENFSLDWLLKQGEETMPYVQEMDGVQLWKDGPLWADRNLGASLPKEIGDFFAWGETSPKQVFGWGSYAFGDERSVQLYGNATLLKSHDAASAIIDEEGWSIPTEEDFLELRDRCNWTWCETDGQYGYEIEGELGSIFLPAAGYMSGNRYRYPGDLGYYWTASASADIASQAREYYFNENFAGGCFNRGRDCGHVVRAIKHQ